MSRGFSPSVAFRQRVNVGPAMKRYRLGLSDDGVTWGLSDGAVSPEGAFVLDGGIVGIDSSTTTGRAIVRLGTGNIRIV